MFELGVAAAAGGIEAGVTATAGGSTAGMAVPATPDMAHQAGDGHVLTMPPTLQDCAAGAQRLHTPRTVL